MSLTKTCFCWLLYGICTSWCYKFVKLRRFGGSILLNWHTLMYTPANVRAGMLREIRYVELSCDFHLSHELSFVLSPSMMTHNLFLIFHVRNWKVQKRTAISERLHICVNLIDIWQMSWWSHNLNHDQTKHTIENFVL